MPESAFLRANGLNLHYLDSGRLPLNAQAKKAGMAEASSQRFAYLRAR